MHDYVLIANFGQKCQKLFEFKAACKNIYLFLIY